MDKFNIFEFKIGKGKKSLKEWIKIGVIVHFLLDAISLIPGVEKRKLFNLVDELQLKLNTEMLNDYIIRDAELLSYRIDRVITKAIEEYENPS
jgi:hypothetical protein